MLLSGGGGVIGAVNHAVESEAHHQVTRSGRLDFQDSCGRPLYIRKMLLALATFNPSCVFRILCREKSVLCCSGGASIRVKCVSGGNEKWTLGVKRGY